MRLHTQPCYVSVTAVVVGLVLLGGCQKTAAPPESGPPEPAGAAGAAGSPGADAANVSLSAEDKRKLGVTTVQPKPTSWNTESSGIAVVVSHDGIAQAVAELASAQAANRQSRAAVARAGQLADSAGALSAEARESAERQAGLDAAALALAERRLSSVSTAPRRGRYGSERRVRRCKSCTRSSPVR